MLPLGRGLAEQKAYIHRTLDLITGATGARPAGWSSPSVYSNGDTMQAISAEGVTYTIDQMDSDVISRLKTPDGAYLCPIRATSTWARAGADEVGVRDRDAWLDYVLELAREARADPARATTVAWNPPFVVGTPDGAAPCAACCSASSMTQSGCRHRAILKAGAPEMTAATCRRGTGGRDMEIGLGFP